MERRSLLVRTMFIQIPEVPFGMVGTITAADLREKIDSGVEFEIVDTRSPANFQEWRIHGAKNFPFEMGEEITGEEFGKRTGIDHDEKIVTVCAKGESSYEFGDELIESGYTDVTVVEGGMEAWSSVYDVTTIPTGETHLEIVQLQRRAKGCLGYVICSTATNEAAVVDATRHTDEFVNVAEDQGCKITHVFDTHIHADHLSGGRELARSIGASYHLPAETRKRGVAYQFEPLGSNEVIDIGGIEIKAVPTPGHTSDIVSYLIDDVAMLTGDTLFVDSIGRTELEFGDQSAAKGAKLLYASLNRTILSEPDSITILPGHFTVTNEGAHPNVIPGKPVRTTVGQTRTGLPILQLNEEAFVERLTADLPQKPPNYDTIIAINTGTEQLESEQEAVGLELGPNRCAVENTSA